MIRPKALERDTPYGPWSCKASDIWATLCAARDGDVVALRGLLDGDPNLYRSEYWYTQPIWLAVREGRAEATRVLLEAGADPDWKSLAGENLHSLAGDRGHHGVVELLESWPRVEEPSRKDAEIHRAAAAGDVEQVAALLDHDADVLHLADSAQRTPLHCAVAAGQREVVELLLTRGADPNWPEGPAAPRGGSLHVAADRGDRAMVELLLAHGADPNATIDSAGSATFAAATSGLRPLLEAHGGHLDPFDLVFLGEDEEALARVTSDLPCAQAGCGGVLAAACTLGKRDLVERLLAAGVRVPATVTECRTYLWCDPELLRLLLASGMDPDLPDWQRATPLHSLCERDYRGRPRPHRVECAEIFLDAGASLTARDEDYGSTPLAFAARHGLEDMVELLLGRGAPPELDDDPPWATPLAWAERRGHGDIAARLRRAGAGR